MVETVPNAELVKIFTEAELSQEDCELVAQKFELDTVKKFVDIFDPESCNTPFRPQMFDKIPEWERQLGKVGRLRDALKIASEWEARRLGAVSARDAAELDDPIGTKQHEALCSAFKRKHNGLAIPTSWVWTETIIGRCFRALQLRRMDRDQSPCGPLKMYQTADDIQTILCSTQGATKQLAPGVSLTVQGQRPPDKPKQAMQLLDCWQYLWALTFWAHSFAISGCYPVDKADPAGSYQVELNDLYEHTAHAAAFVMKHLFGKQHLSKEKTFTELKRHDENIRALWGSTFRDHSDLTFSQCMKLPRVVAYAERAWETDYSMYQQQLALCNSTTSKAGAPRGPPGTPVRDTPRNRGGRGRGGRSKTPPRSGDRGRDKKRSRSRSRGRGKKRSRSREAPKLKIIEVRGNSATSS